MRTPTLAATLLVFGLTGAASALGLNGTIAPEDTSLIRIGAAGAKAGPNGGQTTVVEGHPVEFVSTDAEMTFYLSDEDGTPLATKGLIARAIVQADGKTEMVTLTPAAPNKLVGPLKASLNKGAKVVLSTKLHGHSLQARFAK